MIQIPFLSLITHLVLHFAQICNNSFKILFTDTNLQDRELRFNNYHFVFPNAGKISFYSPNINIYRKKPENLYQTKSQGKQIKLKYKQKIEI